MQKQFKILDFHQLFSFFFFFPSPPLRFDFEWLILSDFPHEFSIVPRQNLAFKTYSTKWIGLCEITAEQFVMELYTLE